MHVTGAGTESTRKDYTCLRVQHKEKCNIFNILLASLLIICATTIEKDVVCKSSAIRVDFILTPK